MESNKKDDKKIVENFKATNNILIFFALLTGLIWIGLIAYVLYTTYSSGGSIFSMSKSDYGESNYDKWLSFCTGDDPKNEDEAFTCNELLCGEAAQYPDEPAYVEWCNYYGGPQQQEQPM